MRRFALLTVLTAVLAVPAFAQTGPFQYFPLSPCRAVDTRSGPAFGSDTTRNFQIRGVCGVPTTAKAVSLNVTITQATASSFLTVWPSGTTRPVVSMINFEASDPALGNGVIVGVSTNTQDLSVYNNFGAVHVIIDVTGYFQ
jgi:hypothetical protein